MKLSRSLCLALFACSCAAVTALPAWADLPSPYPRPQPPGPPHLWEGPTPKGNEAAPQPPPPIDPVTGKELFDTREKKKPQRTGPFRSCGSGMGLGLAGIGLAWGMFWLGNRFAGRIARGTKNE